MRGHRKAVGVALAAGLAWAVTLAAGSAAGGEKNQAATPSPRMGKGGQPDANWMKRHASFIKIAKRGDVDVLFLGDSITDAWGGEGHSPKAAGTEAWKKSFAPLKAANFGIGGDRTQHVLWRISNGELEGIKPRVAVLMIGTNNTGSDTAEQIAAGIKAIVYKIEELSPQTKTLLLGVFPRGDRRTGEFVHKEKLEQINKTIAKLDDGKRVKYLDIGAKFLKDGMLSKEIMPDMLHLSSRGYEIWAEAIAPTVREMLGKKE
jgi:lysophospholipase L1-like esterase